MKFNVKRKCQAIEITINKQIGTNAHINLNEKRIYNIWMWWTVSCYGHCQCHMIYCFSFIYTSFHFISLHLRHIDANKSRYIDVLKEAVAIKSVSAWPDSRPEIFKMVDWTAAKLKALGAQVELADLGEQTLHDGTKIPLPKAILGQLGNVSKSIEMITNVVEKRVYRTHIWTA